MMEGTPSVGKLDAIDDGETVGLGVPMGEGGLVAMVVGIYVGSFVGLFEGQCEGSDVGLLDGFVVGSFVLVEG